jgi:hypothetical protein
MMNVFHLREQLRLCMLAFKNNDLLNVTSLSTDITQA